MKGYNKICFAVVILLFVVGVVFLGISMFGSNPGKHDLDQQRRERGHRIR